MWEKCEKNDKWLGAKTVNSSDSATHMTKYESYVLLRVTEVV